MAIDYLGRPALLLYSRSICAATCPLADGSGGEIVVTSLVSGMDMTIRRYCFVM